jgi:hypothetical protein
MSSSGRAGLAGLAAAALVAAGCGSSVASGSATSAARAAARKAPMALALADGRRQVPAELDRPPPRRGTMTVTAVITWFSAAVGGLFLLAARLTGYTSGFRGAAAARLPVPVIFAGPAAGSAAARYGMGAMT